MRPTGSRFGQALRHYRRRVVIDSAGLGELVGGLTRVVSHGGQLKLLNLTARVSDLLQITKLVTVFEVFDDEAEAIESFAMDAQAAIPTAG